MRKPDPMEDWILNQKPAQIFSPFQNENKLWCVEIPGDDGAGVQRFMAPDLTLLVSKLANSIFHGTRYIRQLNTYIKSGTDDEAEARFYSHPDRELDF
jgi:hypothetical protein